MVAPAPVDVSEHYATKAELGEIKAILPHLATKADLAAFQAATRADTAALQSSIEASIAAAKSDMEHALRNTILMLAGMMLAGYVALLVALIAAVLATAG